MTENDKHEKESGSAKTSNEEDEVIFGHDSDGMSSVTARLAISKKLRKQLLGNYDLIELVNKGRYYTAKAYSKDGHWLCELLIDKQDGEIQIVSKKSGNLNLSDF